MHGESNNAKTKKKTVRNCDIINIKIKSSLYSVDTLKCKRDGGPIFAILSLGFEQHNRIIYD